ncbi:hypothetical protein ACN255_003661, partial [Vibrio cholerae]|nr:hypothetical protein [Vibrio cholerae]HDL9428634.1 hypothetical protein [Vibrio cholerae]
MSHYFGIEEIRTKLIVVTGLALSGEEFCKRYRMGSDEHHKIYNLTDYKTLTKTIISNHLIEISVKVRCLVDTLSSKGIIFPVEKSITTYGAGSCADGKKKTKGFRFICNKIIHADSFNLDFIGRMSLPNEMVWWSGEVTVSGCYQGEKWEFFFSVLDWCDEVMEFLKMADVQIDETQGSSRDLQQ